MAAPGLDGLVWLMVCGFVAYVVFFVVLGVQQAVTMRGEINALQNERKRI